MSEHISLNSVSENMISCLNSGLIDPEVDASIIFYDFDQLKKRIDLAKKSFSENTLHTVAIKTNPLTQVLNKINEFDFGVEAASEGELFIAEKSGFASHKIVFDSPAKTVGELTHALKNNIQINADSLIELDRIAKLKVTIQSDSRIGLRVNPQVGTGKIEATSVAGEYSKFGVPVKTYKSEIINAFVKNDWLHGIHIHIGSQGCEMNMLLKGFETILELVSEINNKIKTKNRKISFIDIGGGIPVGYYHHEQAPDITKYGAEITKLLQKYNLKNIQLITEFGRYYHANSGYIVSKVEYAKHYHNSNTLIIHSGADILLRECLNPGNWYHEISLLDRNGRIKHRDEKIKYHIAGPLCFAGDIVARNVELPKAEEGDYIVIHDTGGYTFAMWSKYVSRLFPKVIGIENKQYQIIKKRETVDDILKFWS